MRERSARAEDATAMEAFQIVCHRLHLALLGLPCVLRKTGCVKTGCHVCRCVSHLFRPCVVRAVRFHPAAVVCFKRKAKRSC